MSLNEDILVFAAETEVAGNVARLAPWRILVVDDDSDVHDATRFGLGSLRVFGRPLQLTHAYSGKEAMALLTECRDEFAVILLDVVMEREDAGLQLVDFIRNKLLIVNTRIILRTGQPGRAPEVETITRYDINDYRTKNELTQDKLHASLATALRSYKQLRRLDDTRRGLEIIVSAGNQFIAEQGMITFAEGVITQIASLIGVTPDGLVCVASEEPVENKSGKDYRIIAAAGQFRHLIQKSLQEIGDEFIVGQLTQALETRQSIIQPHSATLYFCKSRDEGFAAFIDSTIPIKEVDQDLLAIFCTNISLCAKNIALVAELRRDAFIDRQTGLPNRTALVCELNNRIKLCEENELVLAIVDLDQFSAANDYLGHEYGDLLLALTAQRLRDGMPESVFLARLAGDAFAVIGGAKEVTAARLQDCFKTPFLIERIPHPVSASVGMVVIGDSHQNGIEYVKDSYIALKRAKVAGLGQTVVFSNDVGIEARERSQLLRDLRLAFDHEQLFLAYQPQIDLNTGCVTGFEALLRWTREDGQTITPDRFIPVAEQSGLIVGIGNWLLQTSLLALQRFQGAGFPGTRMAVNISAVQLRQSDFADLLRDALHHTQSAPGDLEIEITESVAVGGLDPVIKLLHKVRETGTTVAIDDFGTGYSSLSYLDRLPADRLKIDRSFVHALARDDNSERIARSIILLGNELGLKVIAEGIENAWQARRITELGCHEGQGYFFGKPMPEDQMIQWLAQHSAEQRR